MCRRMLRYHTDIMFELTKVSEDSLVPNGNGSVVPNQLTTEVLRMLILLPDDFLDDFPFTL